MTVSRGGVASFYLRHEYAVIYVVSSIVYIAIGLYARILLNWIVGPLWPIACMWFVPWAVRRIARWDAPLPGDTGPGDP